MMREGRIGEKSFKISQCPRASGGGVGKSPVDNCPALELVDVGEGGEEFLEETVSALLGCRAFLWDVLLDGEWTGCAAKKLRELAEIYGWEKVCAAFEED